MMSNSLYQLTNEFTEIVNQLEELELDQDTFRDTLDSLQAPIEEKVENIVKYMKTLEALADAKKLEAKRLSESASSDLKKVEYFKNYMADNLKKANIKEMQAGVFSLKFRKGAEAIKVDETKTPSVDEAPHLYLHQEPKFIGKTDLKKLIKDGQVIPGVWLVRNEDSLTIK
jgi:cell division septum initiation protein DivIVA